MQTVGVITHKHVARHAYQNRIDVDGFQQGSKQYASVHTVNLCRLQGIVESTYALSKDHVGRQAAVADGAVFEPSFLQNIPQGIHLLIYYFRVLALVSPETVDNA